jgi:hypothetical protein
MKSSQLGYPMKENLMRRIGGWHMIASLMLAMLVAGLGAGCAQDIGDIDRTQPNKIKKELFLNDDVWYYRQTVIDTDMQGSVIFEALESPLKRIRWEVTEDTLYALSTVPLAEGIQDDFTDEESRRLGAVAAFPITSHFDVQRQYSASTGEQTNVIVENSSDRPWFEREYMRVDWSTNLVDGRGMFGNALGTMASISYNAPQTDTVVNPNRARITDDYIDVTTHYTFRPDIYACVLNVGSLDTISACEGGRVSMRNSFLRIEEGPKTFQPMMMTDTIEISEGVGEEADPLYTALVYDPDSRLYMDVKCDEFTMDYLREEYGVTSRDDCSPATFPMFSRFGYFRTKRIRWNEDYPNRDSDRLHYANHWQIWQTAYDEDGSLLPPAERDPQPIVYHLNAEYPRDMIPAAQEIANQWDLAFLESVAIAQSTEAAPVSIEDVRAQLAELYNGDDRMFKIVQNSCMPQPLADWKAEFGGSAAEDIFAKFSLSGAGEELVNALWAMPTESRVQLCAELEVATLDRDNAEARFTWERVGDLRYSFFNWVDEFNGYWSGYGPSAADPLTGQIISGNANMAGTPFRSYANRAVDIIKYINGELSSDDIRTGRHVEEYLTNLRNEVRQSPLNEKLPPEFQEELTRRTGRVPSAVSPTNFEEAPSLHEQDPFIRRYGRDRIEREAHRLSQAITNAKRADTRLVNFYNKPKVKNFMMRNANFQMTVKAIAIETFGPEPTDAELHQAYLDLAAPKDMLRRSNRFNRFLAERNIFASENLDYALASLVTYDGVAKAFKGKSREEIRRYLTDNAFIGTGLHEVGHTVGLRHNFGSSMDALNYHDGFWQIKADLLNGTLQEGENVEIGLNGVVHITDPELAQKYTDAENVKYVSTAEMRLGSIMDYTGDMTGRFAGLGKYDQAAINFVYSRKVQVWDEGVELPNLIWYEDWTRNYTQLPSVYGGEPASHDPQVQLEGIDIILNQRHYIPIKEAIKRRRNGIIQNSEDWKAGELGPANQPYIDMTVPYTFCSDEFRDSRLGCDVFDWGANQTEVVNHAFNTYRFLQPFWRYMGHKNDQLMRTYVGYINRVARTFAVAERPFRYYSIYQWSDLGAYTEDLQRASVDALNFYAEVMATPEPGRYCLYDPTEIDTRYVDPHWHYDLTDRYVPTSWLLDDTACANYIDIPRGPGQFYNFNFTDEYDYRISRVGTYIDKTIASQSIFDISANYAYSAFFTDFRSSNISFWSLFEEEMNQYLRGIILGDYSGFSGTYDPETQSYQPPVLVDYKTFGTGDEPPAVSSTKLYTPVTLTQQFNTVALGMIFNSTWEDRATDFSNWVKVAVTTDESQPYPDSIEVAKLIHPVTGQTYTAPQTADGKSITYDMIVWANDLKDRWQFYKDELATAEPGTTAYENAWRAESITRQQFEDVVAKLDMIRFVFDAARVMR